MPQRKNSDIAFNVLAFILAGACTYFAGQMILKFQGMENPPADMGLNFPPPKKKVITDDAVLVDSLITQSIAQAEIQAGRYDPTPGSRR